MKAIKLTRIEMWAVWDALDSDIASRLEASRDEFGRKIPGETIADVIPAQKRAQKKIRSALNGDSG